MAVLSNIAALTIFAAALQTSGSADETPAAPLNRIPPDYPAACQPEEGAPASNDTVIVTFGVTRDGLTENVRVMESTDPCFDETAIAAVRSWRYEPRRVDERPLPQEDLETTFTFIFDQETKTQDFDARPLSRVPPEYPERCWARAKSSETVLLEFDVTAAGETENISVVESSNSCFDYAAEQSVTMWRYRPKTLSGKPVVRRGVRTAITFQQSDSDTSSPELEARRIVVSRLEYVRRTLQRTGDWQAALKRLEEIEAEYGDSFSPAELGAFHHIRAIARIRAGNYAGALDDLRVVQRNGMAGNASEAVGETILQLEAYLAEQEDRGASQDDGGR